MKIPGVNYRNRVLVACEFTGAVRDAFAAVGFDAWSCDLIPSETPGQHIIGDVRKVINNSDPDDWDLLIAHPPCQFLSYAGNRWLKVPGRAEKIEEALEFFQFLLNAPIPHICIENPRGFANKRIRKPDQIIEPYQFGHPATKATCLWLKDLPPLMHTLIDPDPVRNWARNGLGFKHNAKNRSRTFPGIARAMANQWRNL